MSELDSLRSSSGLPQPLQAARLRLVRERPYLASALWALIPVEHRGLETLAVDKWWRLYFDPAVSSAWTVEELAGVLYHEVCHLLRSHPERSEGWDPLLGGLCVDAEVNDDLLREGVRLPGRPITPAMLKQPEGLLAEEYYAALTRTQKSAPQARQAAQPSQGGGGETCQGDGGNPNDGVSSAQLAKDAASAPRTPGAGAECGSTPSPKAEGSGSAAESRAGVGGGVSSTQPCGPSGSRAGADGSSKLPSASAQPGGPSGLGGTPSPPTTSPVTKVDSQGSSAGVDSLGSSTGSGGGSTGNTPVVGAQTPAPGAGRCGSCAHGHREPWELGPPEESGVPGVGRVEAELIRRQVAEAIRIAASSDTRGAVPGHWKRWAEEKLRPRVDWRRELSAAVRHALADASGALDYSYRRLSRRQAALEDVVLPALRQPVPEVAVVVDTSGSISDQMLSQALGEVAGVLRACGLRQSVHVLAVDAQVQSCRRVFRPEQVTLAGGGGTDMRVGIDAALKLRPRPQVVVVLTDGYTPWPEQPPAGVRVVVGLLGGGEAPEWARTVRIEAKP